MFAKKTDNDDTYSIDDAIRDQLDELKAHTDPDSDKFDVILKRIERLHALTPDTPAKKAVDINQMLAVGGNLAGILMILGYEHGHVVASKALGFVLKSKA